MRLTVQTGYFQLESSRDAKGTVALLYWEKQHDTDTKSQYIRLTKCYVALPADGDTGCDLNVYFYDASGNQVSFSTLRTKLDGNDVVYHDGVWGETSFVRMVDYAWHASAPRFPLEYLLSEEGQSFSFVLSETSSSTGGSWRYGELFGATVELAEEITTDGVVYIHDGTEPKKAIALIHDGTEFKRCIPCIHNGTEFVACK